MMTRSRLADERRGEEVVSCGETSFIGAGLGGHDGTKLSRHRAQGNLPRRLDFPSQFDYLHGPTINSDHQCNTNKTGVTQ